MGWAYLGLSHVIGDGGERVSEWEMMHSELQKPYAPTMRGGIRNRKKSIDANVKTVPGGRQ